MTESRKLFSSSVPSQMLCRVTKKHIPAEKRKKLRNVRIKAKGRPALP